MKIISITTHRPDLVPPPTPAAVDSPAAATVYTPPPFPADGPALWRELHTYALDGEARALMFLDEFSAKLPCGHCRAHWFEMVQRTPPDLSDGEKFFAWTVARHNEVNAQLGKPDLEIAAARERWHGKSELAAS